jgi:hypothetical protein
VYLGKARSCERRATACPSSATFELALKIRPDWYVPFGTPRPCQLDLALPFRRIATLRRDNTLFNDVEELRWRRPKPGFEQIVSVLDTAKTLCQKRIGPSPK